MFHENSSGKLFKNYLVKRNGSIKKLIEPFVMSFKII